MSDQVKTRKKLIEVALPLDAINAASAREKSIRHGHPSTLHLWWARRPLATARAVLFAQMVDDPSSVPEEFPAEEDQEHERQRLFRLIEQLVQWENTINEEVLSRAREEIWRSWRRTCADNRDHPRAAELFNPDKLPAFHDPFAGGGSIPLEAQRLGLEAYASELNPVAVLINKAMIEIPPQFAGCPPVNPEARKNGALFARQWKGAQGLADDVRYYGKRMRDEAERRIGSFYPKIEVTPSMARDRPDLKQLVGKRLTIIAWIWARTVKSPNPAFGEVNVPLASTFLLASKPGKEAYIEPVIGENDYSFDVKIGRPDDIAAVRSGTKLAGANFRCVMSGAPISADYIRGEAKAGRMGTRLMAIVAAGERARVYLPADPTIESAAQKAKPAWEPDVEFLQQALGFRIGNYGMSNWSQLFSRRQLLALTTFVDLLHEIRAAMDHDASLAGISGATDLSDGVIGRISYGQAVAVYLAFAIDKSAVYWNTLCPWLNQPKNEIVGNSFSRQTVSMVWDYAEANPFSDSGGNIEKQLDYVSNVLVYGLPAAGFGKSEQADAATQTNSVGRVISTDPPYYDNIGYADLSDFFYVWLRPALRSTFRDLFGTVAVPKEAELVATPYRHGGSEKAEAFFLAGMRQAMRQLAFHGHPAFPITIYYAFKQAETDGDVGVVSTGWETFLAAVVESGLAVVGTWPMRTERPGRIRETGSNALASSIILVCRSQSAVAHTASRLEFQSALRRELPSALAYLEAANIAPVDLAQAAIGPAMAIYTRWQRVIDADGKPFGIRQALGLINEMLDQVLADQEGDFDPDTRWALAWFEEAGFSQGDYGRAELLSKAKNTSVGGMVDAGIVTSHGGKVRLLRPDELDPHWDPQVDRRLTVWETVHQLIRALDHGEHAAADLVSKLNSEADVARELAYRLYTVSDRKKRSSEAQAYNALVQSWPEILRLAQELDQRQEVQAELL